VESQLCGTEQTFPSVNDQPLDKQKNAVQYSSMAEKKSKMRFGLDRNDLDWGEVGSRAGGSASARVGRASATTGKSIYIQHLPTKIKVEGTVEKGYYSKSEMKHLRNQLFEKLLKELENKVAKKLRVPGR